jgi:hypothetical protein
MRSAEVERRERVANSCFKENRGSLPRGLSGVDVDVVSRGMSARDTKGGLIQCELQSYRKHSPYLPTRIVQ